MTKMLALAVKAREYAEPRPSRTMRRSAITPERSAGRRSRQGGTAEHQDAGKTDDQANDRLRRAARRPSTTPRRPHQKGRSHQHWQPAGDPVARPHPLPNPIRRNAQAMPPHRDGGKRWPRATRNAASPGARPSQPAHSAGGMTPANLSTDTSSHRRGRRKPRDVAVF